MENPRNNIMGYEKIPKLVMKISTPLMISMLVQALYNVVDSIFVAMVSETALTAVSLAFPIQNLLIAFAVGTSVGVNSFLARKLGEGNQKDAEKSAGNGLLLAVITWFVFMLVGGLGSRWFLSLYTENTELLSMSTSYAQIVTIFSFGMFVDIMIERILQATGDSIHPMITQLIGAITNIILDPIIIFVFKLGVQGAAIATVIGQFVGMFFAIFFVRKNKFIKVRIRKIRPSWPIIRGIYNIGVPTIITNSIGTVMVSLMNSILISFSMGETAVSVFGVYFKIQSFIFMPIFGLTSGMVPIIAFNYGAGNKGRMLETIRFGLLIALLIMGIGTLIFQLFPEALFSLFSASPEMLEIGVPAFRIISLHFMVAAICITFMSTFQATGIGIASMTVSIARQLVVLIPSAWILGHFFGLNALWYSFLLAELTSLLISSSFFIWIYKTKIKSLESKKESSDADNLDLKEEPIIS